MEDLKVLFLAKTRMVRNNIFYGIREESKVKGVVVTIFGLSLLSGGYFLFAEGFRYLLSVDVVGQILIERLLAFFFMVCFWMLVISSIIVSFSTLYRSKELEFLFAQPFDITTIFTAKFLETLFYSSWAFLLLCIPLFLAFGRNCQAPLYFYIFTAFLIFPFLVITAAIGAILTMLAVRYLSKVRYLPILSLLLLMAYLIFRWSQLGRLEDSSLIPLLNQLSNAFKISDFFLLPNHWVTAGLLSAAKGNGKESLFYLLVLVATGGIVFQCGLFVSSKLYYSSWSSSYSAPTIKRYPIKKGLINRLGEYLRILSLPIRSLAIKDIKLFLRTPSQWSQLLIFFGLLALYFANLRSPGYGELPSQWKNIITFLNLGALSLVLASFTTRLAFPLISLEGRKAWIVGLAPISWQRILKGKFYLTLLFTLLITEGLMIFSNLMLRVTPLLFSLSCGSILLVSLSLSGLAIGLGGLYPDFKSDDIARIVSGIGGTLCFLFSTIYLLLFLFPLWIPFHLYLLKIIPDAIFRKSLFAAFTFACSLTLFTTLLPLVLGATALTRREFQ
ncbi:MAG: hypothetical protein KAX20_04960 [Candidatus Omnitrophica bacterium]|nr:hypothetical protein [Candidatus Omnitrophota bacterium]